MRSEMAQRLTDFETACSRWAIRRTTSRRRRPRSAPARARERGRDPRELIYDYLIEGEGKNFIFAPFANYAAYNLDCCSEMMQSPHTLIGLGDGGAHVGLISDGSYPTYLLQHWGRDRKQGRLDVSLAGETPHAGQCQGGRPRRSRCRGGRQEGGSQRHRLRPAARRGAGDEVDLPAGGKRLLQRATGYRATIVSVRSRIATARQPARCRAAWCAARRPVDRARAALTSRAPGRP